MLLVFSHAPAGPMPGFEEAFVAHLLDDAGVTDIAARRIGWATRPQGSALPAVTLHKIAPGREYHMGGPVGLNGPLVQIDCWGSTYGEAKRLARAVIASLDRIRGGIFQAAFLEGERDSFEPGDGPRESGAADYFRTSLDARVWHIEP